MNRVKSSYAVVKDLMRTSFIKNDVNSDVNSNEKISNQAVNKRPMVQAALLASLIMAGGALTGCDNNKTSTETVNTDTSSEVAPAVPDAKTNPDTSSPDVVEGIAAGAGGVPVSYDMSQWDKSNTDKVAIDDLKGIQSIFGEVVSTDKNSLDYVSNPATKYRFMSDEAAYLDVIDSQKYLEVGWYYANPTDSDEEKATSIKHAKKAYQFARQLMGDEGGSVVEQMLGGQIIKDKTIDGITVQLAKCEFYSCMLIIKKPS